MKKLLYVAIIVALATCVNLVLADEKGTPVGKAFGKLFSPLRPEAKEAEQKLLSDKCPETLEALEKEIELGCKSGNYEKVRHLAKIRNKMLSNSTVRARNLIPAKKQIKQFTESTPPEGRKPKEAVYAGEKLPDMEKKEKGGQK